MTEYAVRLANDPVVHSIQIDDGRDDNMPEDDEYRKAHELVLNEKQHL